MSTVVAHRITIKRLHSQFATFHRMTYKRKLHRTTIAGKAPDTAFAVTPSAVAAEIP